MKQLKTYTLDDRLFIEILLMTGFVAVLNIISNILLGYAMSLNIKWMVMLMIVFFAAKDAIRNKRLTLWKNITFGTVVYILIPLAYFEIGSMSLIHLSYAFLLTVIIGFLTKGIGRWILIISHIWINFVLYMLQAFYPEIYPTALRQVVNEQYAFMDIAVQFLVVLVMSGYLTMRFSNVWRDANQELNSKNKQLEWLANHDELTKVHNRRYLLNYIEKKNFESRYRLIIIDIDDFKGVNDEYGHSKGDQVLIHLASKLDRVTGNEGIVTRFGGDEFVVLVDAEQDKQNDLAEKIAAAIDKIEVEGVGTVTVSGGSVLVQPNEDFARRLGEADKLLYWAKKHGKKQLKIEK